MIDYCILIVDDDPDLFEAVKNYLEFIAKKSSHTNKVLTASNMEEARTHLKNNTVDILFLDYYFGQQATADDLLRWIEEKNISICTILISSDDKNPYQTDDEPPPLLYKKLVFDYIPKGKINRDKGEIVDKWDGKLKHVYDKAIEYLDRKPLPNPIEITKKIYEEGTKNDNHCKSFDNLRALSETLMRYLICIIWSSFPKDKKIEQVKKAKSYMYDILQQELCRLLDLEDGSISSSFLTEMGKIADPSLRDFLKDFHGGRNEYAHATPALTDSQCKDRINHSLASLSFESLKRRLHYLSRYPLVYVEDMDYLDHWRKLKFKYQSRVLMGYSEIFTSQTFHLADPCAKNRVYILHPQGKLLSLDPFLIFRHCEQCERERLFLMSGVATEKVTKRNKKKEVIIKYMNYKCVSGNHEFPNKKLKKGNSDEQRKFDIQEEECIKYYNREFSKKEDT